MHILLALFDEVNPHFIFTKVLIAWGVLVCFSQIVLESCNMLFVSIKIWNFTIIQNVVNIFKE